MQTPTDRASNAAGLVRQLTEELDARGRGRPPEVAALIAWMRDQLGIVADALTPAHSSRSVTAKAPRRGIRELN